MRNRQTAVFCSLIFGMFAVLPIGSPAQEKGHADKRDAAAKEIAEKFMTALMKGDDVDRVMKTVGVPFFAAGEKFAAKVFNDPEQLKEMLDKPAAPPKYELKVLTVYPFGALPASFFGDNDHKLVKEILKKDDRIVMVRHQRLMAVAVRFTDGDVKVVGLRAQASPLSMAAASHERDKADKAIMQSRAAAKETATQFLKAVKDQNLDALVKLNDVPWYEDGTSIINEEAKLKDFLKRIWVDRAKNAKLPSDVVGLIRCGEIGDLYGGTRIPTANVAAKDDWLVFVGNDGMARGFFLVKMRDGKGKVVGAGQ